MQQPHLFRKSFIALLLLCIAFAGLLFVTAPGKNFPSNYTFAVEKGDSLKSISLRLLDEDIIRSRTLFEFFVILDGADKNINEDTTDPKTILLTLVTIVCFFILFKFYCE